MKVTLAGLLVLAITAFAAPEADPTFKKTIIVARPVPVYPRYFWKREAEAEATAEADPTFKKKTIIVARPVPVYPRYFW